MKMPKKRKRDIEEVDHPRITYDAVTRTFDRLFKEDNLEEMKEVVRKKLGVSDSVPIFLSQIREGRSVDLEDDDDFEAFRAAARGSPVVCVKVFLGDHPTASEPAKNENSTPISSSKKRKKKKSDMTATSSATNINSVDEELSAPVQKKRRVSFAEPSTEQLIEQPKNSFEPQESSVKRKAKVAVTESSAQSFHHSLAGAINTALNGVGSTSESAAAGAPEVKEKRREAAVAGGEKRRRLVNNNTQSATGAAATAATTPVTPEMPAPTRSKKRPRSDVPIDDQPPESSTFTNSASTSKGVDAPQPKKISRKVQKETVDDSGPTKSRPKSVSPSSIAQAPTMETPATSAPINVQAKVLLAKTKKPQKKNGDRDIYEPLSASVARALTPEPVEPATPEEIETSQIKKIKKNVKPTAVGEPSGTKTVASNAKGKKQAISNEKHSNVVPATETTMKAKKRPGKAKANATASDPQEIQTLPSDVPTDKDNQNTSSVAIEAEAPKRKGRKSEAAENAQESGTELDPGKSQGDEEPTNRKDLRAATLAAVHTVLTRKGITAAAKSSIASVASPPSTNPPTEKGSLEALSVCSICNESPNHGRTVCPVIKGGVRAMRKRVAQLEKDPSGNEANQEVIAELQAIILKRSRKPRTTNVVVSTDKKKAATTDNGAQKSQNDASAAVVKSAEPVKQVDVVSSAHVVDAVPPSPPPQPLQSTLLTVRQPQLSSSQPLLRRSQPSSSSQKTTQVVEKAPVEKVTTLFNNANVLNPFNRKGLSRFTDKDLENFIYGPKMSIDDVQSSNEEEEEEREEVVSDEDEEANNKRLSQKTSQANYPSSSEKEDEDDSGTGSGSKSVAPFQPSIAMDNQPNGTGTPEDPLLALGVNTSLREVDTRGSSRELDTSANDAVNDALAGDLSSFHVRLEPDSDTVVASQSEEFAGRPTKTAENVAADAPSLDLIEPSEPPEGGHMETDQIEPIASDDGGPAFPKLKLVIRRSQRNKASVDKSDDLEEVPATQEDTQIVEGRKSSRTKFMKKITALPVPPNPSVRSIKPRTAMPHLQNGVGVGEEMQEDVASEEEDSEPPRETVKRAKPAPKSLAKNAKTTAKPASKAATSKGKKTPARATRSQATVTPKPRRSVKITGGRSMPEVIDDSTVTGSQWAVLPESEPSQVMETPGQIDELLSDPVPDSQVADKGSSQRAMVNGSSPSRDPLFLPSETQESFSYSQHPSVIFGSQRKNETQELSPHDSEDEEEVLASVTKVKTRYRGLSQIAGSQSAGSQPFSTPKYQSGNVKVPGLDLYGNRNRNEESEDTESESTDDDEPLNTHIPTLRQAGLQRK